MSVFLQTVKKKKNTKAAHCASGKHARRSIKGSAEGAIYNQMPCACAGVMAVKDKRGQSEGCAYKYKLCEREGAINTD